MIRALAECLAAIVVCISFGVTSAIGQSTTTEDSAATSQTSRAEEWRARRAERLSEVQAAKSNYVVDFLATVETDGFDQLVAFQAGDFRVGLGKISPVSSLTPAIRYERPRLGGTDLTFRASGAYSVRGYQVYDLKLGIFDQPAPYDFMGGGFLGAPFEFDQRAQGTRDSFLYADLRYNNLPREEFFGMGPTSSGDDRTEYRLEQTVLDLVAGHYLTRWAAVEGRFGLMKTNVGPGSTDTRPSSDGFFAGSSVPGLNEQTDFLRFDGGLYAAWEADPNKPSGIVGARFGRYSDRDLDRFSFSRYSFDARGYLPLGSRQRVLATRFYSTHDTPDDGSQVPFYLMKTLGGHETLRGFRDFRFRDENLLYFSAEYRWEATTGVELAAFYDTGKVYPGAFSLDFDGAEHTAGGGIRFKSMRRVVFRVDVGAGNEGIMLYFAAGQSF